MKQRETDEVWMASVYRHVSVFVNLLKSKGPNRVVRALSPIWLILLIHNQGIGG